MLVYGDAAHEISVGDKIALVRERLTALHPPWTGIEAHSALVGAFIETAELAQGIADAEFERQGMDTNSPEERAVQGMLLVMARAIQCSWHSGFGAKGSAEPLLAALSQFTGKIDRDRLIRCRTGEGYAHYAVYPEAFLCAGGTLPPDTLVIGIRSIGLGLAAAAATGANAPPPISVRPVGHPFRREITLARATGQALLAHRGDFAIVDEGPGLSGSSFGAVADFLEEGSVAPSRLHFLPSHAGDLGPQASARHRSRWQKAARHVADFDALALRTSRTEQRLSSWVADLTGPAGAPLEDLSAGRWREYRFAGREWPPAFQQQERRKFLLRSGRGTFLLKFAGLGRRGEAKLARARALHEAGFTPEVLGYRHGFLVERWLENAEHGFSGADREGLLPHLGRYLAFRAKHFAAEADRGASLNTLVEMARANTCESLGPEFASCFDRWKGHLVELSRSSRPIEIDGRLHQWEWLRLEEGKPIKTDALDHHAGHDLVGCQDVAWDVAGAAAEFELSRLEREYLAQRVERESGYPVAPALIDFLLPCYLAFQIGLWTLAASAAADAVEAARTRRNSGLYAEALRRCLIES